MGALCHPPPALSSNEKWLTFNDKRGPGGRPYSRHTREKNRAHQRERHPGADAKTELHPRVPNKVVRHQPGHLPCINAKPTETASKQITTTKSDDDTRRDCNGLHAHESWLRRPAPQPAGDGHCGRPHAHRSGGRSRYRKRRVVRSLRQHRQVQLRRAHRECRRADARHPEQQRWGLQLQGCRRYRHHPLRSADRAGRGEQGQHRLSHQRRQLV
ncbi:hypothetical protein D3C84_747420 [compost metagenome]